MARATSLRIGLARADITPPAGTMLVGYKPRQATTVGHALRTEALACRNDRAGWVLVLADTIGFPLVFTQRVRAGIRAGTGLPPHAILLAGTHTHSGPPTIIFADEQLAAADLSYLDALAATLVDTAVRAWREARPGRFEAARTHAPALLSNRRVQAADGTWTNEWLDPEGRHRGFADPAVLLLGVRRDDGACDGLAVNYGCHPVVLGPQSTAISADYPGYLKDALEQAGTAATAIFVQAGGANINPRTCIQDGAVYPQAMGAALAAVVASAVPALRPLRVGMPRAAVARWEIVRTQPAIKRTERPDAGIGAVIHAEVQALSAGGLAVIGVPGELFSEYSAWLRALAPNQHMLVVSLANDYVGYLPTDTALAEGAYEARMAPAAPLQAELLAHAQQALAAVRRMGVIDCGTSPGGTCR